MHSGMPATERGNSLKSCITAIQVENTNYLSGELVYLAHLTTHSRFLYSSTRYTLTD